MNRRQKNAVLIFRISGVILSFIGIIFMFRRSYPYPVANISYAGAALFAIFLMFVHILPGLLLFLLARFFGALAGRDLND